MLRTWRSRISPSHLGLTFLLIPKQGKDPKKEQMLKDFVQYVITQGQNSSEGFDHAKLPGSLASQDQALLQQIQGGGQQTSSNQARNR